MKCRTNKNVFTGLFYMRHNTTTAHGEYFINNLVQKVHKSHRESSNPDQKSRPKIRADISKHKDYDPPASSKSIGKSKTHFQKQNQESV